MSEFYLFPRSVPIPIGEHSKNELTTMQVLDNPDFEQYSDWVDKYIYIPHFGKFGSGTWDNIVKTVENGRGGL